MTEEQKRKLEQKLWNIANELRDKMEAYEYRDYILGFIFYKYLSERMHIYADSILRQDNFDYDSLNEDAESHKAILEAIREASIEELGYFLKPSQLFSKVANRDEQHFILDDLGSIFNSIQLSTMGTESEEDFDNLFEELDLTSTKLGRTVEDRNKLVSKILGHLEKIDFRLKDTNSDVLGDAYEYLIAQFASGAGKKAGEFYTPQAVSTVLARIVTNGKSRLRSVYDPTCGSGSLLLRVAKEVKVTEFFGQEMNRTTFNLARMNMILHNVHYRDFDLKQDDTLEHPQHEGMSFEAVVANPPFSANWSANPLFLVDDRFSQFGKLAPKSYADFAFVQHMLHHLDDNGIMAVILSHGVLFRGKAEGHIRKYLLHNRNWLDAVIGLPANIFNGTTIPTCILVFKKCRETEDVLFVDASKLFEKRIKKNILRPNDVNYIVEIWKTRKQVESFSYLASMSEIEENDWNLSISRYVDNLEPEVGVNLDGVISELNEIDENMVSLDDTIREYCHELRLDSPV